jgi:hypothetical protein
MEMIMMGKKDSGMVKAGEKRGRRRKTKKTTMEKKLKWRTRKQ